MCKILQCMMLLMILIPTTVIGGTLIQFGWTANTDGAQGYKLVMDCGDNVIVDVLGQETITAEYMLEEDKKCHVFSIFAYRNNDIIANDASLLGDFVIWCPIPLGSPQLYKIIKL